MTLHRPHAFPIARDQLTTGQILHSQMGLSTVITRASHSVGATYVAVELCAIERIDAWLAVARTSYNLHPDALVTLRTPTESITTWLTDDEAAHGEDAWRSHVHVGFLAAFRGPGQLPRDTRLSKFLNSLRSDLTPG